MEAGGDRAYDLYVRNGSFEPAYRCQVTRGRGGADHERIL